MFLQKDGVDNLAPLTKQNVLNTLKTVVQVMLWVHLHETPDTESPAAQKIKHEQSIKLPER